MSLGALLVWRLRLARAASRGRGGRRRALLAIGGAMLALFFFLLYFALFQALHAEELDAAAALVLAGLLHALLVLSLLRDTAGAVGHLFLSSDASFLLAAPLGPRPVVFLKAVEALADGLGFPLVFVLPGVLAYGVASGAPGLYYAAAPFALVAILATTIGAGFLLALFLGPRLPPGRVREILGLASGALLLAVWLALLGWSRSAGGFAEGLPEFAAPPLVELLRTQWLPSGAAAQGLIALSEGRASWTHGSLVLFPILALWVPLALRANEYAEAWQRAGTVRRRRATPRTSLPASLPAKPAVARFAPHRPGTAVLSLALAFVRRDLRLYRREPSLLADVAALAVMTAFLPLVIAPGASALGAGATAFVVAAVLFVSVELGFDFGSRSLPLERRAFARVVASPWSAGRQLLARAVAGVALAAPWILGVAVVGALTTSASIRPVALALLAGIGLLAASVPSGLLAGVYFGRSDWRHPRQMLTVGGRWVLAGLLLVLGLGFWVSLGLTRLWLREVSEVVRLPLDLSGALGTLLLGLAAGAFFLARAIRGLRRSEWLH